MRRWLIFLLLALAGVARAQGPNDLNEGSVLATGTAPGTFTFSWYGHPGRTYFLQQTDDLVSSPWTYVPAIESGSDQAITWGFSSSTDKLFLKLKYTDIPTTDPLGDDFDGDHISNWDELIQGTDPLSAALDVNGLPFDWEKFYSVPFGTDSSSAAPRGDGLSYMDAFLLRANPNDCYNGQTPVISIVSGDGQTGNPGGFVPEPLVVSVTDSNGQPYVGAPVAFSVSQGGGTLQDSSVGAASASIAVLTDSEGLAQAFFQFPDGASSASRVTASAGSGSNPPQVPFNLSPGSGSFPSPFDPTNVVANFWPDGSMDVSWTNKAAPTDTNLITIQFMSQEGNWVPVKTDVPAGATFVHIPAPVTALSPQGATKIRAKINQHLVPRQSYAVLDISGTIPNGRDVCLMALKDDNAAAFAFNTPESVEASGTCYSYTWNQGIPLASGSMQLTRAYEEEPDPWGLTWCGWLMYRPTAIFPDGKLGGVLHDTSSQYYALGEGEDSPPPLPPDWIVQGKYWTEFSFWKNDAPVPVPAPLDTSSWPAYGSVICQFSNCGDCAAGAAYFWYVIETSGSATLPFGSMGGSLAQVLLGGTNGEKVFLRPSVELTTSSNLIKENFAISAINNTGCAAGAVSGTGAPVMKFWDGTTLRTIDAPGSPLALNDSNDVMVSGTMNADYRHEGAFLLQGVLQGGTDRKLFVISGTGSGMIPNDALEDQLRDVQPFAFSNRLEASGTAVEPVLHALFTAQIRRSVSPETWDYATFLMRELSDGKFDVQEVVGLDDYKIQSINAKGIIAALGIPPVQSGTAPVTSGTHALLLAPISLTNLADPTVRNGARTKEETVGRDKGIQFKESDGDTSINCVAWIAGNDPTKNNAPRMPQLKASSVPLSGVTFYWHLQVVFHDENGNPHRDFDTGDPNQTNPFPYLLTDPIYQPGVYEGDTPDQVVIPAGSGTLGASNPNNVTGWKPIPDGGACDMSQEINAEATQNGFFGGDAILSLVILDSGSNVILPRQDYKFRIAGENPDRDVCKTFINNNSGGNGSFAYAIAKHETHNEGGREFYNQFLDNGGAETRKVNPWPGHEGRPAWNNDTYQRAGVWHHNIGSGGYGLFQLTYKETKWDSDANDWEPGDAHYIIPRDHIWNWQSNTLQAMSDLKEKAALAQSLFNGLNATYSATSGDLGNYYHLSFSSLDALTITFYNAMYGGRIKRKDVNGYKKAQATCWDPQPGSWQFLENANNYVDEVNDCMD